MDPFLFGYNAFGSVFASRLAASIVQGALIAVVIYFMGRVFDRIIKLEYTLQLKAVGFIGFLVGLIPIWLNVCPRLVGCV